MNPLDFHWEANTKWEFDNGFVLSLFTTTSKHFFNMGPTERLFILEDYDQPLGANSAPVTAGFRDNGAVTWLSIAATAAMDLKRIIQRSYKPANLIRTCCCVLCYPHKQHMALFWLSLLTTTPLLSG